MILDDLPKPIPSQGILAFGSDLMVRLYESGSFWVLNGHWEGFTDGETLLVEYTGKEFPLDEPFKRVMDLTSEERRKWFIWRDDYIDSETLEYPPPKPASNKEWDDDIPF